MELSRKRKAMQTTDHAWRDFHLKLLDDGRLPNTHLQEMTNDNVKLIGFDISNYISI